MEYTSKKLYLTKQETVGNNGQNSGVWNYVGDPIHPNTTMDVGLVEVLGSDEIEVDDFGIYVIRYSAV